MTLKLTLILIFAAFLLMGILALITHRFFMKRLHFSDAESYSQWLHDVYKIVIHEDFVHKVTQSQLLKLYKQNLTPDRAFAKLKKMFKK